MATKRLAIAALSATLTLTACVSPYEASIKIDLEACRAGNKDACFEATALTQADQRWHAQKNAEVGHAIAVGALILLTAGAAAAAASHPAPPPPPPVFIPAPPIPLLPLPR